MLRSKLKARDKTFLYVKICKCAIRTMYIQRHYFSVKWEGVEFVRYIIKTFYIVYIWYAQLFKSMQYKKGVKNTGIVNIYTYT